MAIEISEEIIEAVRCAPMQVYLSEMDAQTIAAAVAPLIEAQVSAEIEQLKADSTIFIQERAKAICENADLREEIDTLRSDLAQARAAAIEEAAKVALDHAGQVPGGALRIAAAIRALASPASTPPGYEPYTPLELVDHAIREKKRGLYSFAINYDRPGGPEIGFDGDTNEFYMALEELGLKHLETIRAALAAASRPAPPPGYEPYTPATVQAIRETCSTPASRIGKTQDEVFRAEGEEA